MPREPSSGVRGLTVLIVFLLAAAAIWACLEYSDPHSTWLRVEAPRQAVEGQQMILRVHLAPQPEPGILYADLHWGTSRDKPMQYLATGGPRAVGKDGGTYDFQIMVPHREGLRFVMGVLFWTRTGGWSSHKLAASTKLIPVIADKATAPSLSLEPVAMQSPSDVSPDHPRPAALPRWLTGLLFLAALVAAWRAAHSGSHPDQATPSASRFWRVLLVLLALAFLWEVCGLERWIGSRARAVARAEDLYYPRAAFQKVVISAAAAATIVLLLLLRRARASRRLLLAALGVYAAISLVNLVSLHAIDSIADRSWQGLTIVQALKLGCAAFVLVGVRKATAKPDRSGALSEPQRSG